MQYQGGKDRLGARIAAHIESVRAVGQTYLEPFIGGCGVFSRVSGSKMGGDYDPQLIAMWRAASEGWVPPTTVSESDYAAAKAGDVPEHVAGFIKYACSWGGKPWGGYGRDPRSKCGLADTGSRAVVRKVRGLVGAHLQARSYELWEPVGCVIYCDPPYAGTTRYERPFDSTAFWALMRRWAAHNTVLVSEYSAPPDAPCVLEMPITANMARAPKIERLFHVPCDVQSLVA